MPQHYLIDAFTNPVSSAPVVDVTEPANGQSVINGSFVVRVPEFVPISTPLPSTLGSLITKKYAGLLSFYTGFTSVVYDDMLDTSGINFGVNPVGKFGVRGNIAITAGTTLQSVATPLGSTPEAAVLTWEVYTFVDGDPKAGSFTRKYAEVPTTSPNTTASVSFNGGGTWTAATDSGAITIPVIDQGNSLIVRITNATGSDLGVGSWALIY